MAESVRVTSENGTGLIVIDNAPVNALDREVREALMAALARLSADPNVQAIVITGAGRTFVAGADIRELEAAVLDHAVDPPDVHGLLQLVEDCRKPVVMALGGVALGGGLELAMAGHYRLAAPTARLGLPEVNLGIIPGAEGTQRLTRLVGVEKALDMCVSGKPIDAEDARQAGLVDLVVEGDLAAGAAEFARDVVRRGPPHPRTRERADRLRRRRAQRRAVRGRSREGAPDAPPPDGSARGGRGDRGRGDPAVGARAAAASGRCRSSACARSRRARCCTASSPSGTSPGCRGSPRAAEAAEIREVAVIGAGTMGTGIAMACANAGLRVRLADASSEALEQGLATLRRNYQSSVDRGRLSPRPSKSGSRASRPASATTAARRPTS